VSGSWLVRFAATGLGIGVLLAYGSAGLAIDHWMAIPIISITVLYVTAQVFHVLILRQNGITYLSYFAVVQTPYTNVKSLSLQGRDVANTKVVLWPSGSCHDIGLLDDKVSTMVLELTRENRKRRVPLRFFSRCARTRIIQTLLERIKQDNDE